MGFLAPEITLIHDRGFIDGQWVSADSQSTMDVVNPATGDVIGTVPAMGRIEACRSIDAAHRAFPKWARLPAKERAKILRRWFDLIIENKQALATLLTAEQGKPIREAHAEIDYGAAFVEWFGEEAKRLYGDVIPGSNVDSRVVCLRQPVGVVAAVTPWNFPVAMITRKAAPALAAGCSIVIKPSEETPLSALALADLADMAGIPPGVLNVVVGPAVDIGAELTTNPKVRKFTFTGSTPVGKLLAAQCVSTMKRTSLELGGNAPFIVFDDANLGEALCGLMESKFRNAGQTCVCTNRIFVQRGVYDQFVTKLVKAVKALKVGVGSATDTDVGPLISEKALRDVEGIVRTSVEAGATIECGGKRLHEGHTYYMPTVLTGDGSAMEVFHREIFGPVAPVIAFDTEEEVVALANDTEFGLASYLYTRDVGRIWRVSEALEFGMVGTNSGSISNEAAPFGGIKESGSGREGSKYGLDDYTEIKYVLMAGLQ